MPLFLLLICCQNFQQNYQAQHSQAGILFLPFPGLIPVLVCGTGTKRDLPELSGKFAKYESRASAKPCRPIQIFLVTRFQRQNISRQSWAQAAFNSIIDHQVCHNFDLFYAHENNIQIMTSVVLKTDCMSHSYIGPKY